MCYKKSSAIFLILLGIFVIFIGFVSSENLFVNGSLNKNNQTNNTLLKPAINESIFLNGSFDASFLFNKKFNAPYIFIGGGGGEKGEDNGSYFMKFIRNPNEDAVEEYYEKAEKKLEKEKNESLDFSNLKNKYLYDEDFDFDGDLCLTGGLYQNYTFT